MIKIESKRENLMPLVRKIVNGIIFYVVWFICVANGASGSLLYVPAVLAALITHFILTPTKKLDFWVLCTVLAIGLLIDSLYIQLGAIRFMSPNPLSPSLAPFWVLGIYAVFASAMTGSLNWLDGRFWLAALLGSSGGVLSYSYGQQMGAAEFLWGWIPTMCLIGAVWFCLLPLCYVLIGKIRTWVLDR